MKSAFTIFEYLYRDSSNYKVWGQLRLAGTTLPNDELSLRECLEAEELFVAEQIGIPVLYRELWSISAGRTIDDHAYHEFIALRPSTPDEDRSVPLSGNLSNLLDTFKKNKHRWCCALSPNS